MKTEATYRAIAALREKGDDKAVQILHDDMKIDGSCQYCQTELSSSFEVITLLDMCENCWLVKDVHPAQLKPMLLQMLEMYK